MMRYNPSSSLYVPESLASGPATTSVRGPGWISRAILSIALSLPFIVGCASAPQPVAVGGGDKPVAVAKADTYQPSPFTIYIKNRARDFVDPVKLRVGFSGTLGGYVKATDLLWLGLGMGGPVLGVGVESGDLVLGGNGQECEYTGLPIPQFVALVDNTVARVVSPGEEKVPVSSALTTYGSVHAQDLELRFGDEEAKQRFMRIVEEKRPDLLPIPPADDPRVTVGGDGSFLVFPTRCVYGSRFLGEQLRIYYDLEEFIKSGGEGEPRFARAETVPLPRRSPINFLDVDVGAGYFLAGAEAGFSPGELLDFLVGFFGFDPARDDK